MELNTKLFKQYVDSIVTLFPDNPLANNVKVYFEILEENNNLKHLQQLKESISLLKYLNTEDVEVYSVLEEAVNILDMFK